MVVYELGYVCGGCVYGADDGSAWGAFLVNFRLGVKLGGPGAIVL